MLILSIFLLLSLVAVSLGLTITQAEYFVTTDPGVGNGTAIAITPGETQTLSGLMVPTTGLTPNRSHRVWLRYRSEEGPWSLAEAVNFFLFQPTSNYSDRTVTHVEYWFDNLPGTIVDIADDDGVSYAALLPTTGLATGVSHKFSVRYYDNTGRISGTEARYFLLHQDVGGITLYNITQLEYHFDSNAPVLVDLTDATFENYTDLISLTGLSLNVSHKFTVRYLDERGFYSNPEARFVFLHQDSGGVTMHDITHLEYWYDSLPHTLLDIADTVNVDLTASIPHSLSAGPHFLRLRYRDDRGLLSLTESRPFFVWTGAAPHANANIAGMELWVNADPGVGNGLQISFPVDGTWDEATESADTVLTGIPTGIHRMGVRFRDELGHWSITLIDTFVVGPVLVIRTSGNDVILNWIADAVDIPFHVYRASGLGGPFTEIAQTNDLFYTDAGVISGALKQFYYVTWTNNGFSSFRLPREPERSPLE